MKKTICILLAVLFCAVGTTSVAEMDLSGMTLEELYASRLEINNEIASRNQNRFSVEDGITIADLFPDTWIARHIRDELGKFSTKDNVTQEELDTIFSLRINGQTVDHIQVTTLDGVQYLRNLTRLEVNNQENISEIPEWVGTLTKLTYLEFRYCPVKTVPGCICDLTELEVLNLFGSSIEALPDDIGNLLNLNSLNISYTKITELPASIYNLSLETFNREGLDID